MIWYWLFEFIFRGVVINQYIKKLYHANNTRIASQVSESIQMILALLAKNNIESHTGNDFDYNIST